MKKSEFKKIIKPIVNECIKESLLEEGLIAGIIAEVVKGMNPPAPLTEQRSRPADPAMMRMQRNAFDSEQAEKLKAQKQQLLAAIGTDAYNGVDLFEGTTPAPSQKSPQQQAGPMAGQPAGDPGVDIGSLFGAVGRNWTAHMSDVKEGK